MNNERWDDYIKQQFADYSPEVPSGMWERIAARKKKHRPFWWSFTTDNYKALLVAAGVALVVGIAFWVFFKDPVHPETGEKEATATAVSSGKHVSVTTTNTFLDQGHSTGQEQQPAAYSRPTAPAVITRSSVAGTAASKTAGPAHPIADGFVSSEFRKTENVSDRRTDDSYTGLTGRMKKKHLAVWVKERNTDKVIPAEMALPLTLNNKPVSGLSAPSLISSMVSQKKSWFRTKFPECPVVEKKPSRSRDYIEVYGSPDYGIRSMHDNVNPPYLKSRDSSSGFTSAFSVGARYTRVFNNGFSLRAGLNYSQINEWFTPAKNNIVSVTYNINPSGDTTVTTVYKRTKNHYSTLDIPVTVGYEFAVGKLIANVNVGPVINVYSWQNGDVLDTDNNTVHITTSTAGYSPYLFVTNIGIGMTANVSLYYKLSQFWSVMAEPYCRYNFQPMTYIQGELTERYTTIGLRVGARLDLH